MPTCIIFEDASFPSIKKFEEYVRDLIYTKIGLCNDVKNKYLHYETLVNILKRHPDFDEKTKDMNTFKIIRDSLNKSAFKIMVVNDDGSEVDISWRCAIRGKGTTPKQELMSAMRNCIKDQIYKFKRQQLVLECELCDSDCKIHVDHIIQFDGIAGRFINKMKTRGVSIPAEFDDEKDTHRRRFKSEDSYFELKWKQYHLKKSKLRILCDKCNLSRKKS